MALLDGTELEDRKTKKRIRKRKRSWTTEIGGKKMYQRQKKNEKDVLEIEKKED